MDGNACTSAIVVETVTSMDIFIHYMLTPMAGSFLGVFAWLVALEQCRKSSACLTRRDVRVIVVSAFGIAVLLFCSVFVVCVVYAGAAATVLVSVNHSGHLAVCFVLSWHTLSGLIAMCVTARFHRTWKLRVQPEGGRSRSRGKVEEES